MFAIAVTLVSIHERSFLRAAGWDPIKRTAVEWPSILALGNLGSLIVATFIISGALGLLFAQTLYRSASTRAGKLCAALLFVMSMALALEAFRADSPARAHDESWHASIHNAVYPLLPTSALAAVLLIVFAGRHESFASGRFRFISAILVSIMVVGLALQWAASVAQLGRYIFFAPLLVWYELLARQMRRTDHRGPVPH